MGQEVDDDSKPGESETTLTIERQGCCDTIWACLLNDYLDDDLLLVSAIESKRKARKLGVLEPRSSKVVFGGDLIDLGSVEDKDKTKKKGHKKKKRKSHSREKVAVAELPEEPSLKSNPIKPVTTDGAIPAVLSNVSKNTSPPRNANIASDRYHHHKPSETRPISPKPVDNKGPGPARELPSVLDLRPTIKKTRSSRSKAKEPQERQMSGLLEIPVAVNIPEKRGSIPFNLAVPKALSTVSSRTPLEPEGDEAERLVHAKKLAEAEKLVEAMLSKNRSRARRKAAVEELELLKAKLANKRAHTAVVVEPAKERRSPEETNIYERDERSMISRKSHSRHQHQHRDVNEVDMREPDITRDSHMYDEPTRRTPHVDRGDSTHTRSKANIDSRDVHGYNEVIRRVSDLEMSTRSRKSTREHSYDQTRTGLRREADQATVGVGTPDQPIEILPISRHRNNSSLTTHSSRREERELESFPTMERKYSLRKSHSKSIKFDGEIVDEDNEDEQMRKFLSDEQKRERETRRLDRRSALLRIRAIKTRIANS
jgi:hypothetical protein